MNTLPLLLLLLDEPLLDMEELGLGLGLSVVVVVAVDLRPWAIPRMSCLNTCTINSSTAPASAIAAVRVSQCIHKAVIDIDIGSVGDIVVTKVPYTAQIIIEVDSNYSRRSLG
jgi:hypothetical protein